MTRIRDLIALTACAAVPAGCGDQPTGNSGTTRAQPSDTAATPTERAADPARRTRGPLVKLRDSQLGPVIFSGRDQAAYTFTRDRSRSRCYGECAEAWPPFLAGDKPSAGAGVDGALLGTVRRRDGRRQVTYAGQPLYFYEHDPKGEVLCNDIAEFGGTWFAVTAEGKPPPA
jgi:predicted lipoprotein with Yx(FWY)xxD motif